MSFFNLFLFFLMISFVEMTTFSREIKTDKVAVIMYGQLRSFESTRNSIIENVLKVANADVFFAGPPDNSSHELSSLQPWLKASLFTAQPDWPMMKSLIRASQDANYLLESWSRGNAVSGVMKYDRNGNPQDPPIGGNLYLMMWQSIAYDLFETYESTTNTEYEWVFSIRPDMEFGLPIPNATLLKAAVENKWKKVMWYMDNHENYGGINDRFVFLS
jgi:hypothetical protein